MELMKKLETEALSLPITDCSVIGIGCSSSPRKLLESMLADKSVLGADLRNASVASASDSLTTFCNIALAPAAVKTPEALSSAFTLDDNLSGSILRDFILSLSLMSGGFTWFSDRPAASLSTLPIACVWKNTKCLLSTEIRFWLHAVCKLDIVLAKMQQLYLK